MAEQAQALKAEAHRSCRKGCLSGFQQGMGSLFAYISIAALCDGLQARYRIYARTNAALVDRRGLGSRL